MSDHVVLYFFIYICNTAGQTQNSPISTAKSFHITVYIRFRLKKQRFPSRVTPERNVFMLPKVTVSRKPEGRQREALSQL